MCMTALLFTVAWHRTPIDTVLCTFYKNSKYGCHRDQVKHVVDVLISICAAQAFSKTNALIVWIEIITVHLNDSIQFNRSDTYFLTIFKKEQKCFEVMEHGPNH